MKKTQHSAMPILGMLRKGEARPAALNAPMSDGEGSADMLRGSVLYFVMFFLTTILTGACGAERTSKAGHPIMLIVSDTRPKLLPELLERASPLADSASIELDAQKVRNDTVFGVWKGELLHLGVRLGGTSTREGSFSSMATADSIRVVLSPETLDGRIVFRGIRRGPGAVGTWYSEASPRMRGAFRLSLVPNTNQNLIPLEGK